MPERMANDIALLAIVAIYIIVAVFDMHRTTLVSLLYHIVKSMVERRANRGIAAVFRLTQAQVMR